MGLGKTQIKNLHFHLPYLIKEFLAEFLKAKKSTDWPEEELFKSEQNDCSVEIFYSLHLSARFPRSGFNRFNNSGPR